MSTCSCPFVLVLEMLERLVAHTISCLAARWHDTLHARDILRYKQAWFKILEKSQLLGTISSQKLDSGFGEGWWGDGAETPAGQD